MSARALAGAEALAHPYSNPKGNHPELGEVLGDSRIDLLHANPLEPDGAPSHAGGPDEVRQKDTNVRLQGYSQRRGSTSSSCDEAYSGQARFLASVGDDDCYEMFEVTTGDGVERLETVPETKTLRGHRRNFIIRRKMANKGPRNATQCKTGGFIDGNVDRFDYEKRYPSDERGKEMEPNARVWRVYLDEAGQFDVDMVENMRDTVDVILVFAGLFSAIVTTLVALTATALQLDHPKVTNMLLMEIIALQRATAAGSSIDSVPPSTLHADSLANATAETTDYWINGLWFTSLAFSLSTALLAVLVKQWIQAYIAPTFQGSPKAQAEVRHFRYYGIEMWHVPLIIGLLPTLLHLSLFLFFAGLVVFLFTLDTTIASVVTAIISMTCIVYMVSNLLPVWFPSCPYRTPWSDYAFFVGSSCRTGFKGLTMVINPFEGRRAIITLVIHLLIFLIYVPFALVVRLPWYIIARPDKNLYRFLFSPLSVFDPTDPDHTLPRSLKETETRKISRQGNRLHARMFAWLIRTTPNPSARSIVMPCSRGDPVDLVGIKPPYTSNAEWAQLLQRSIMAQLANPEVPLPKNALTLYVQDLGCMWSRDTELLVEVRQYLQSSAMPPVNEESLDRTSSIDWQALENDLEHGSSGTVLLRRFCLYALHYAVPDSEQWSLSSLLKTDIPSCLIPTMSRGYSFRSNLVRPNPGAVGKLRRWLPMPDDAHSLSNVTASQLQLLLGAAAFLLRHDRDTLYFCHAFRDGECLAFWRLVFEHHYFISADTSAVSVAETFQEMMEAYIRTTVPGKFSVPMEHAQSQKHVSYIFSHLSTICLWEAARYMDETPWHIERLVQHDPWSSAWLEVKEVLEDLLPKHGAMQAGAMFLARLDICLKYWRDKKPRIADTPSGAIEFSESVDAEARRSELLTGASDQAPLAVPT